MVNGFQKLPNFLQKVTILGYHYFITHFLKLCLIPLMAFVTLEAFHMSSYDILHLHPNLLILVAILGLTFFTMTRQRSVVYLIDFSCYRSTPPRCLKFTSDTFMEHMKQTGFFDDTSLEFQSKILRRSGICEETTAPEAMMCIPPQSTLKTAREEAETVIFGALDNLFANNIDVKPEDIGILVVSSGTFSPLPSLSSTIVNKYKMRSNIRSFNLGGMGCSSGVIAIDLAKNMLQVHKDSYAIVVTTENITRNWYPGNKKEMLIPLCLFRVGGAAVLLSNRNSDRWRAKYKLVHLVRTHKGANDTAFKCIYQARSLLIYPSIYIPKL